MTTGCLKTPQNGLYASCNCHASIIIALDNMATASAILAP